jgi:hypothetical protein
MIKRIDFFGSMRTPMRAVYISKDETSPNHIMTYDKDTLEFYDMRYQHTPDGQFISRYNVDTLLDNVGHIQDLGLDLMGYVESWKINPVACRVVMDWVSYLSLCVYMTNYLTSLSPGAHKEAL